MFDVKKKLIVKEKLAKKKSDSLPPFEERETLHSLSLLVTIVNRNQGNFFVDSFKELGASLSIVLFAHSMPPEDIKMILGGESTTRKDMVLTVVRSDEIDKYLKLIDKRFKISNASKGVAFTIPLDSISGIVVYKYLADQNKEDRQNGRN